MTTLNLATLKLKFMAGNTPSGQDWIDLLDSLLLADQSNFPNPLPAVGAQFLVNIPTPSASTINVAEFNTISGTPQYVSANSFIMTGNIVTQFPQYRRIILHHPSSSSYLTVSSSSYNSDTNTTTVNVFENIVSTSISTCGISLINPISNSGSINRQTVGFTRGTDLVGANTLDVGYLSYTFNVTGNSATVQTITQRPIGDTIRLRFTGTLM
jgi:hypothetical protein